MIQEVNEEKHPQVNHQQQNSAKYSNVLEILKNKREIVIQFLLLVTTLFILFYGKISFFDGDNLLGRIVI